MDRNVFITKLAVFQTSDAPFEVKEKAINRLKNEFLDSNRKEKEKQIMYNIALSSAELLFNEIGQ